MNIEAVRFEALLTKTGISACFCKNEGEFFSFELRNSNYYITIGFCQ